MSKQMALVDRCTNHMTPYEHDMRDNCWTCAPFWDVVPLCPVQLPYHPRKLNESGYCRGCHRYYDLGDYRSELSRGRSDVQTAVR